MRRFLIALALLALAAPRVHAAVVWKVEESTDAILRVRVSSEGARVVERSGPDGTAWLSVELPGAPAVGETGSPMLPRAARWVALPPEGAARVDVEVLALEELGQGRVVPVPTSDVVQDDQLGFAAVERAIESEAYASFRIGPSAAAALGDASFHRRQRMAPLRVQPVLYDAATGRIRLAREILITVHFPPARTDQVEPGAPDDVVAGVVLNPGQAAAWRCLSPAQREKRDAWRTPRPVIRERSGAAGVQVLDPAAVLAPEIRIRVGRTGIARVRLKDLVDDHGFATDVPRRFLRLVRKRGSDAASPDHPASVVADVPFVFAGGLDENGVVTDRDEFFFYGLSAQDDWTDQTVDGETFPRAMPQRPDSFNSDNVYFLLVMDPGTGSWARMPSESLAPSSGANLQTTYRRRELFTGDLGYRDDPRDPTVERYYWNDRLDKDVERGLRLVHPAPGSVLDVRWKAGGHSSARFTDNRFSLVQNGQETLLNDLTLSSAGVLSDWSRQLSTDDFQHGPLTFRVQRLVGQLSVGLNAFFSDVELEYDAYYRADGDQLRFHAGVTGEDVDLEITDFTRTDLYAFDISDPHWPRVIELSAANFDTVGEGASARYTISWHVPQAVGERREFVVGSRTSFDRVFTDAMQSDPVIDLFQGLAPMQILAVGPEEFRAEMQRWVDHRNATYADQGWTAGYVDVQQIYDQFSGGLVSPSAIKAFAEYAYLQWGAVALLLVGDANEDAREIGMNSGPSLVPPSLHLQSFSTIRELLASDKWYATFSYTGPRYPVGLTTTSDMLVGRLTARDANELRGMIDKILAYEQPTLADTWRARTLWMADDAYSTSLLGSQEDPCYQFFSIEEDFLNSQRIGAAFAAGALDSIIAGTVWNADDFTRTLRVPAECGFNLAGVRSAYSNQFAAEFPNQLSQGWLMVSYQGHANYNVLGHENYLVSGQIPALSNAGRPFLFFGMGCHVSDFLRATEGRDGQSLGEAMATLPQSGAIATYGSSGFEFLTPNARFMETISETFFAAGRTTSPVLGAEIPTQWILGDVLAQAELVALGLRLSKGDEMVSQYNLIGDPLLRMDAAPPRLDVRNGNGPIAGGGEIVADAGSATANLQLRLVDESGVGRVLVTDSEGRDYTSVLPAIGGADPRIVDLDVDLPIYPQAYDLTVEIYDAAYPNARPNAATFSIPLQLDLSLDGEPVADPQTLALDPATTVTLAIDIVSPVDLVADDIDVVFEGAVLGPLQKSGSGRNWTLSFDARAQTGVELGALVVRLAGYDSELRSAGGGGGGGDALAIRRHVPFPNPSRGDTRILVDVDGAVEAVRLSVYDLAGRAVYAATTRALGGEPGTIFVDYDARDRYGDELANGTYFYRIEAFGPAGSVRSDMGRLVIMR